jgi:hypothetical protein
MLRKLVLLFVLLSLTAVAAGTTSAQYASCGSAAAPRLTAGSMGMVTPGLPNIIRGSFGKGVYSPIIGEIPGGGVFTLQAGFAPECADGMWWWRVTYNGVTGWTAEGDQWGHYWTQPYGTAPGCAAPAPRLTAGGQGRVTPGLPNIIRNNPWKGSGSVSLGQIPAGGVFTVIEGPRCSNNINWWRVTYNGVTGWTGEGELSSYWVEPFGGNNACTGVLPTRLRVGGWGRVTPGLPNTIRNSAAISSRRLGQIPAGGVFSIMAGPVCANGIAWWQVSYNNIVGWTAEGRWGEYWVEPGS